VSTVSYKRGGYAPEILLNLDLAFRYRGHSGGPIISESSEMKGIEQDPHYKTRKGGLLHGDGCKDHPHCATCPFPPDDCHYKE